jgi:hypothetical protein
MMLLARIKPGPSSDFNFRIFECPVCDRVPEHAGAVVDPMKSKETARWFQGELRTPT